MVVFADKIEEDDSDGVNMSDYNMCEYGSMLIISQKETDDKSSALAEVVAEAAERANNTFHFVVQKDY